MDDDTPNYAEIAANLEAAQKEIEGILWMPEPIQLVPGRSDQEIADDIKKRLIEAYQPLIALADEANNNGIIFQCQIGPNAFGKFQIIQCQIMKVFK